MKRGPVETAGFLKWSARFDNTLDLIWQNHFFFCERIKLRRHTNSMRDFKSFGVKKPITLLYVHQPVRGEKVKETYLTKGNLIIESQAPHCHTCRRFKIEVFVIDKIVKANHHHCVVE